MTTSNYLSTRHSVGLLCAHLVFVTKYRRRVFDNAMFTTCEAVVREVCTGFSVEVVEARMRGHFLTSSYFAMSAGGAPLAVLRQYIENQDRPS